MLTAVPDPVAAFASASSAGVAEAGIFFRAAVYGGSGYADGNLAVLEGLARANFAIQLAPMGQTGDTGKLLREPHRKQLERMQKHAVDLSRSVLYQCAPAVDFETHLDAKARVGRTTFETDRLPEGWRERCNALDQVWVPSEFNRRTFTAAGVNPAKLRVVWEGVDTKVYRPGLTPLPIPRRRGFNFLSVFDWIDRKGADVLLRAYLNAFHADDDVTLILKVHKFDDVGAPLEERLLYFIEKELGLSLESAPPILIVRGLLPAAAMPRLYAAADAYVLPSRGEGWGRPYMEAAAAQLAVVATRWSGQLDFLNDANSFLIEPEGIVPVPRSSDREIYIGHRWAEPSADHLTQLMRDIVRDRAEARRRACQARRDMVTRWDNRILAPRWNQAFAELLA